VLSKSARIAGIIILIIAGILLLTTAYQQIAEWQDAQAFPPPGKLVDVGGYRLHIDCTGDRAVGSPTVIFEGGLGASSILWRMVQAGVAPHERACSYDRAGYGWSDPGPQPRTATQIVSEMHTLLERAGEKPPYVLVGHSLGGIIVRLYASQYPAEVAGLVLVDARQEDFFQRMPPEFLKIDEANYQRARLLQAITPLGFTRIAGGLGLLDADEQYLAPLPEADKAAARALMIYNPRQWQTSVAERDVINQSYDEVRATQLPRNLPLIVLSADNGVAAWQSPGDPIDDHTRELWMSLQQDLTTLTDHAQWQIVANSGHYIQLDQPDAVVRAILSLR
jgi:pimeloyl-ACP methyl ester carboxylesterase